MTKKIIPLSALATILFVLVSVLFSHQVSAVTCRLIRLQPGDVVPGSVVGRDACSETLGACTNSLEFERCVDGRLYRCPSIGQLYESTGESCGQQAELDNPNAASVTCCVEGETQSGVDPTFCRLNGEFGACEQEGTVDCCIDGQNITNVGRDFCQQQGMVGRCEDQTNQGEVEGLVECCVLRESGGIALPSQTRMSFQQCVDNINAYVGRCGGVSVSCVDPNDPDCEVAGAAGLDSQTTVNQLQATRTIPICSQLGARIPCNSVPNCIWEVVTGDEGVCQERFRGVNRQFLDDFYQQSTPRFQSQSDRLNVSIQLDIASPIQPQRATATCNTILGTIVNDLDVQGDETRSSACRRNEQGSFSRTTVTCNDSGRVNVNVQPCQPTAVESFLGSVCSLAEEAQCRANAGRPACVIHNGRPNCVPGAVVTRQDAFRSARQAELEYSDIESGLNPAFGTLDYGTTVERGNRNRCTLSLEGSCQLGAECFQGRWIIAEKCALSVPRVIDPTQLLDLDDRRCPVNVSSCLCGQIIVDESGQQFTEVEPGQYCMADSRVLIVETAEQQIVTVDFDELEVTTQNTPIYDALATFVEQKIAIPIEILARGSELDPNLTGLNPAVFAGLQFFSMSPEELGGNLDAQLELRNNIFSNDYHDRCSRDWDRCNELWVRSAGGVLLTSLEVVGVGQLGSGGGRAVARSYDDLGRAVVVHGDYVTDLAAMSIDEVVNTARSGARDAARAFDAGTGYRAGTQLNELVANIDNTLIGLGSRAVPGSGGQLTVGQAAGGLRGVTEESLNLSSELFRTINSASNYALTGIPPHIHQATNQQLVQLAQIGALAPTTLASAGYISDSTKRLAESIQVTDPNSPIAAAFSSVSQVTGCLSNWGECIIELQAQNIGVLGDAGFEANYLCGIQRHRTGCN